MVEETQNLLLSSLLYVSALHFSLCKHTGALDMDSYHENLLMSQRVTKLSGKIFAVCSFTQEIR